MPIRSEHSYCIESTNELVEELLRSRALAQEEE